MRLIDADALVKELSNKYIVPVDEATRGVAAFMGIQMRQAINNAPTIEPKHGRWIKISERNYKCSVCEDWWAGDEEEIKTLKYCPNCGARMDEVEE